MYNLQWNGAGLSVLPSEDDIYTQHVKMEFSYNTKNGHCNVQCNFSSQDCRLHFITTLAYYADNISITQILTDGPILQTYDSWCEQFSCTVTRQTCALLCLSSYSWPGKSPVLILTLLLPIFYPIQILTIA